MTTPAPLTATITRASSRHSNVVRVTLNRPAEDGRAARKAIASALAALNLKLVGSIGKPDPRGYLVCFAPARTK